MDLQFNYLSAKGVSLAEREISFPGIPAEDTGETEWQDLDPMCTPRAGTGVPATYTVGIERERGDLKGKERLCDQPLEGVLAFLITGAQFFQDSKSLKGGTFHNPCSTQPTRSTRLHYKPSILLFFFFFLLWKLLIKTLLFS